jgi:NAD(P)-dependent dehydrogenase (short-subunit alcohol dehydrogenase family)
MARRNRGAIINMSSVAALMGLEAAPHYSAAKGGILALTRAVAREVASRGIRVNAICPGYIDTPMTRVNRFHMPFLISADEAARRIARAIEGKRRLAVIPWQMALVSLLLRAMPGWLFDRLASRAPRKPRDVAV